MAVPRRSFAGFDTRCFPVCNCSFHVTRSTLTCSRVRREQHGVVTQILKNNTERDEKNIDMLVESFANPKGLRALLAKDKQQPVVRNIK